MILIDISQVAIANVMMMDDLYNNQYDDNLIKHMIYNSIRAFNVRFKQDYGDIVICCDGKNYWRKGIFPHYKANRKKIRDDSKLDWKAILNTINKVKDDLREFFPYRVIEVEGAEADDVIAILTKNAKEDVLIIGSDKDYAQLHKYLHVKQYSPRKKDFITIVNPDEDLKRLIMKGDTGDGIPNIKSDGDTFVDASKRQAPMYEKDIVKWVKEDPIKVFPKALYDNYKRNQELIDFDFIPQNISEAIITASNEKAKGTKEALMTYFMVNGMKNLAPLTGQF